MKQLFFLIIGVAIVTTSINCSTIRGVGEDLGTVGGWVTNGSDRVKEGK